MTRRVFLYCRVSTDRQAKRGESLQDQLGALHSWANSNDCVILGEYVDAGASAFKEYSARPEFCRMMADFDRLHPDLLIFTRLDRFARNARDYHNVIYTLEKRGIEWEAIDEHFDRHTPSGQFTADLYALLGEQESREKSARARFTNSEKRKRGELCSGSLPRGYISKDKHPIKDPAIQEGVQAFWDSILAGRGIKEAMRAAELHGFFIPSYPSAHKLVIHARSYSGTIQGVPADPYITPAQADYVESIRKRKIRSTGFPYLFNSLLVCSECGSKYNAYTVPYVSKSGVVHRYGYYRCCRHGSSPDKCSNRVVISEKYLEGYLIDNITDLMEYENHRILSESNNANRQDYTKMINKLKKKKERAVNAYIDGMISREDFNSRCLSIDKELDELYALADSVPVDLPEPLEPLPENWKDIYNSLSAESKHDFWFSSLDSVVVSPDRSLIVNFKH